mgnify:FL=1
MVISQVGVMLLPAHAVLPAGYKMNPIQEDKYTIRWLQAQAISPEEEERITPTTGLMTFLALPISITIVLHSLVEVSPMAEAYVVEASLTEEVHEVAEAISEADDEGNIMHNS